MSAQVQQMFASIAPRYDLVNELMSFGTHRLWRRRAVALSVIPSLGAAFTASADAYRSTCPAPPPPSPPVIRFSR